MLGFDMLGNYEERKVAKFKEGGVMVSTVRVTDGDSPFETAVEHPNYNDGKMIIVERYDDIEAAKAGHARWQEKMTSKPLPDHLVDCCNSAVSQLKKAVGCPMVFLGGEHK